MCLQDMKIGQAARYAARTVVLAAATPKILVNQDLNRIALHIASAESGVSLVSPVGDVTLAAGSGQVLQAGSPAIDREVMRGHADCMAQWSGFSTAGATLLVIEVFADPSVLKGL